MAHAPTLLRSPRFFPVCRLCLAEVSPSAATYSNKTRVLPVRATLQLRAGEAVVQASPGCCRMGL